MCRSISISRSTWMISMPSTKRRKSWAHSDTTTFRNPINELPDGSVQMYLRDPGGNLLEVDWPDITTLDTSRIPELRKLSEFAEQDRGSAERIALSGPSGFQAVPGVSRAPAEEAMSEIAHERVPAAMGRYGRGL